MKKNYLVMLSLLFISCSTSNKIDNNPNESSDISSMEVDTEIRNNIVTSTEIDSMEKLLDQHLKEALKKLNKDSEINKMSQYVTTRKFQTDKSKQMIRTNIYISIPDKNIPTEAKYAMIIVALENTKVKIEAKFGRLVIYLPSNFTIKTSSNQGIPNPNNWVAYTFSPQYSYKFDETNGWISQRNILEKFIGKESSNKFEMLDIVFTYSNQNRSFTATIKNTNLDNKNPDYKFYNKIK